MSCTIGYVDGDGIGPEIVAGARRVCDAALPAGTLEWVEVVAGRAALDAAGDALPAAAVDELSRCDGFLLGPVDHATYPRRPDGRRQNPSGELRRHFDLFANVRPARCYPGVPGVGRDVDLVIVRENTEGFYSDRNMVSGTGAFMPTRDVALTVGVFTRAAITRVTRAAYELALQRRGRLTVVHKANVLPESTGMYLDVAAELAPEYPGVAVDDFHVDAMAAHLVRRPHAFDVIVTENLFGDILSDLTAELAGSLGLAGSLNAGDRHAMAQAAHGSAPDIAGQGVANPVGAIVSAALLLEWLGSRRGDESLSRAGATVHAALAATLADTRTPDLGGEASTEAFTDAVIGALAPAVGA